MNETKTWGDIYTLAVRRGCDHGYAAHLADRWEKRRDDMGTPEESQYYEDDEEEMCSPDDYCGECHRPAVGDVCQQCGLPLCPMHFETQAGFCKKHPDERFDDMWREEAKR